VQATRATLPLGQGWPGSQAGLAWQLTFEICGSGPDGSEPLSFSVWRIDGPRDARSDKSETAPCRTGRWR